MYHILDLRIVSNLIYMYWPVSYRAIGPIFITILNVQDSILKVSVARLGSLVLNTPLDSPNNWQNGRDPWATGLPNVIGVKGASYREAG